MARRAGCRHAGSAGLRGITIRDRDGKTSRLSIDTLAVSGGWNPAISLTTHLGHRPKWSPSIAAFVPGEMPRGMSVTGAAAGRFSLTEALRTGAEAAGAKDIPWRTNDEPTNITPTWCVESRSKSFVDFQNDVTSEDVALAAREGYRSAELLKRYTTLGMATDQGKTSNVNGLAILAVFLVCAITDVGLSFFCFFF